jgi:multimeric flavodoxin WrbA
MTKAFAINGSARTDKGYTEQILTSFLEGIKEAGASVEKVYSTRLSIKPCTGTFSCWYKTPGQCIYKDDMQEIYPKLKDADILVLATPVYIPLPGAMQDFINRLCPLIEPLLSTVDGRTRARFRDDVKISKFVLLSASGWWEKGNFDTLLSIVRELALNANTEFSGALLRPHAFLMDEFPDKKASVLDACKKAGFQLIKEGRMSKTHLDVIAQPLISQEKLRQWYNTANQKARNP